MTRTHTIGTLAAIGGVTATIALLTGLPAANADELADLRANQELLQRRIDQLAQGQPPAPGGIPGGGPGSALGAQADAGRPVGRRQFPAIVPDPGHRHLDPRRRLRRCHLTVLSAGQQRLESRHPLVQLRPEREPEFDPGRPGLYPGWRPRLRRGRAVGPAFARQRGLHVEPAAIAAQRRDAHPDRLGQVADVHGVRLVRQQRFRTPKRAAGRRRQPGPAPQIRLRHVGRVPRRPGHLELLRCRRRHRIDGIRRRRGLDRRLPRPAGALHDCGSVRQRLLVFGGATDQQHDRAGRHRVRRPSPRYEPVRRHEPDGPIAPRDRGDQHSGGDYGVRQWRPLHRDRESLRGPPRSSIQ